MKPSDYDSPFRPSSPFYEQPRQPQLPGLEDTLEIVKHVQEQRTAAIQKKNPELEQIYRLSQDQPGTYEDAIDLLNEIRDSIYRLLY